MIAGYISAETYRAVSADYTYYYELSSNSILKYEEAIRNDLLEIYENEYVVNNLFFLEKISEAEPIFIKQFDKCLIKAPAEIQSFINRIGKSIFLNNYAFCSYNSVRNLYSINTENYIPVVYFKQSIYDDFLDKFGLSPVINSVIKQEEIRKTVIKDNDKDISELIEPLITPDILNTDKNELNFGSSESASVSSYSTLSTETEETNQVSESNEAFAYAKSKSIYAEFLCSLPDDDFVPFEEFLYKTLSKCSIRTLNGIKYLGAREFYVNYLFEDDLKYLNIRNFGKKSLFELNSVKSQIKDFVIYRYENSENKLDSYEIESNSCTKIDTKIDYSLIEILGENKYSIVQNELDRILVSCSVRTQNGIRNYKGDFIEDFVHREKNVLSLKNVGRKSEIEINNIINTLRNFISRIASEEFSQEDIVILKMKTLLKDYIDEFAISCYQDHGYIPMFHVLDNMTKEIVKSNRLGIFNDAIPLFEHHSAQTLDEIALTRNYSRERIRQIVAKEQKDFSSIHVNDDFVIIPNYPKPIGKTENWEYTKQALSKNLIWDNYDLRLLFSNEDISLSSDFIQFVISQIFPDSYSLVGNSSFAYNRHSIWKNSYLISRNLVDAFDFNKMLDIINTFEENSSTDIIMSTQELAIDMFFSAWNVFDYTLVEDLKDVITKLLISEKGIIPELDLSFKIIGKKKEDTSDILYRILFEFGNPMHVDLLFEEFNKLFPNRYKGSYSFTSTITNDPRLCFLGYNKLVTLTEWEHIKTGSIRDLLVQYLQQFDEPQHINTIVEYIQQHRDTSENSLRTTMGSGDQFRIFACGFYGLSGKEYPEKFYLSESEQNSLSRFELIEEFIITNKRFPFFPADSKEEEQLSQWWYRINRQKNLHRLIQEKINWIIQTYGDLPQKRTDYTWYKQYNEYIAYVLKNNRKPEDIELSKWFNKTWNEISEGTLSKDKENAFIELCKKL